MNIVYLVILFLSLSYAQTTLKPPSYPLAVRTPYLSAWLPGGQSGGNLAGGNIQFWTGAPLRWTGIIRVDSSSYLFMGNPSIPNLPTVQQLGAEYTATATRFYAKAGPLNVTISFLSPITPNDYIRQSLPFSYLSVSFASNDGNDHSVQVYTDIDAAWAVRNPNGEVTWNFTNTIKDNSVSLFSVALVKQSEYGEYQDMIEQGSAYYGTLQNSTGQCGNEKEVIATFMQKGSLSGDIQTPPSPLPSAPVFALSINFENSKEEQTALFGIGHVRSPAVLYNSTIPQYLYFFKEYENGYDAFLYFLQDWSNVSVISTKFDNQIKESGEATMENYSDLLELSARQAFAGIEFTTNEDKNEINVYLKEISSDGNVNTVDVIMPTLPIFLYLNPNIIAYLLLPLLKYQINGEYPHQWAMHDMGFHYPNAAGHPEGGDEQMPIEESGNMILMALAHAQATKDSTTLLEPFYPLFTQWADYLVNNTLIPGYQLATTDAAGPMANQTNLAVKGILALSAVAKICNLTNHPAQATHYQGIAESYIIQWEKLSLGTDGKHIKLAYQKDESWGIQFNLLMDRILGLNIVPSHVYDILDSWYLAVANKYGLQLDTRVYWGKTDWNMWCAATSTNTETRKMILTTTLDYVHSGDSQGPLPDRYNTTNGVAVGNLRARPTVGAHFALLLKHQP